MDGDSVAYVVFIHVTRRGTGEDSELDVPPDLPQAITLKRDGGTWKAILDGGLVVWGWAPSARSVRATTIDSLPLGRRCYLAAEAAAVGDVVHASASAPGGMAA